MHSLKVETKYKHNNDFDKNHWLAISFGNYGDRKVGEPVHTLTGIQMFRELKETLEEIRPDYPSIH
jgi:hypothetical protein